MVDMRHYEVTNNWQGLVIQKYGWWNIERHINYASHYFWRYIYDHILNNDKHDESTVELPENMLIDLVLTYLYENDEELQQMNEKYVEEDSDGRI